MALWFPFYALEYVYSILSYGVGHKLDRPDRRADTWHKCKRRICIWALVVKQVVLGRELCIEVNAIDENGTSSGFS